MWTVISESHKPNLWATAAAALLLSRIQVGGPAPVTIMLLPLLAGGAAVIGHIWPLFASFRGGKGVATTIGVLVGIKVMFLGATMITLGSAARALAAEAGRSG